MSTPIGSHHGGNGSDSGSVNALLSIDSEAKAKIRTLVVDDEHTLRETCAVLLRNEGYDVTVCGRGNDALDLLKRRPFDIALVDLYMSQVDGLRLLQAALATNPDAIVIVMTGNPSVESSIEALRLGACNYLPKPFAAQHLQIMIGRAAHTVLVGQETREQQADPERGEDASHKATLLGTSAAFRRVIELAGRVAPTDASVFITGESGSGKELIAQFIHQHSRRSSRPFVAVNCAALPEPLLESEMFGHRKGAFTGAVRDKPGLLETANGGTLFLDELVEMSKPIQAKLLRVIQDGVVRRVGSETTDAVVNVRFIAATNGDPEAAVHPSLARERARAAERDRARRRAHRGGFGHPTRGSPAHRRNAAGRRREPGIAHFDPARGELPRSPRARDRAVRDAVSDVAPEPGGWQHVEGRPDRRRRSHDPV